MGLLIHKKKVPVEEPFRLEVIYEPTAYPDRDIDEELRTIVGCYSDASGYGFGERDHAWYFETMEEAKATSAKIGRKLRRVRKSIRDVREDWEDE